MSELKQTSIKAETENVSKETILKQSGDKAENVRIESADKQDSNADNISQTVNPDTSEKETPELGIKWAKFLGYFALWIGALSNLISGPKYITGSVYSEVGASASYIYSLFPNLLPLDYMYGVIVFIMGVVDIIAAFAIIKRKKSAIRLVPLTFGVAALSLTLYSVGGWLIAGEFMVYWTVIIQIVGFAAMYFINKSYFTKRSKIFIK